MNDERKDSGEYYPGGRQAQGGGGSGGEGGDAAPKVPVTHVEELPERYRESDMRSKINQLARIISGGVAALAAMVALADGGITVQGARKNALYNDDFVVTNVTADLGGYATTNRVDEAVRGTEEAMRGEIAAATNAVAAELIGGIAGAMNAVAAELIGEIAGATNAVASERAAALEQYATRSWVQGLGYATASNMTAYAEKSWVLAQGFLKEIDLIGYATRSWVEGQDYATTSWVEGKGYLTQHQSLTNYATKVWVEGKGYLTEHQSLAEYATKMELENMGAQMGARMSVEVDEAVAQVVQERDVAKRLDAMEDVPGQTNGWRYGSWMYGNGHFYTVDAVYEGTNVVGLTTNMDYIVTGTEHSQDLDQTTRDLMSAIAGMTNGLVTALENGDIGVASARQAGYATDADFAAYLGPLGSHRGYETIFAKLDSATTTNDVCNIVTNELPGRWVMALSGFSNIIQDESQATTANTYYYVEGSIEASSIQPTYNTEEQKWEMMAPFIFAIEGAGTEYSYLYFSSFQSPDATTLALTNEGGELSPGVVITATLSRGPNALGLARLVDLPPLTNGLATASVTNGLATKTYVDDAIAEIPSGGASWGETNVASVISYFVGYEHVSVSSGGTLSASTNDWPNGAAVMVDLSPAGSYTVSGIHLLGYGVWPTNRAEMVVWRSGTNVIANVVLTY